jgi:molybdopterin-guanine dinucleotide biosynthesis adapter protein
MKVFGLAGWSGSGKTSLIIRLLPEFNRLGLDVSTIKHAHHRFDVDKPGKDSWRHREAGATEVLISSHNRWALMHENKDEGEACLNDLIARLSPVDLVLVEGFKTEPHDKLEVHRTELGKPLIQPDDPNIIAVATDASLEQLNVPCLDLNDTEVIVQFILNHCQLAERAA